jgi:hypothetical protein
MLRGAACNASIGRLLRPYEPPLVVAAIEHQMLQAGRFKVGVGAVLSDQQVGRASNVEVGNHPVSLAKNI